MVSNVITPIEMQSIDSATLILGTYAPVNVAGIEGALSYIDISNMSDADIYVSIDGVSDHLYVSADKHRPIYFQLGATPTNKVSKLKKHTIIYVRGVAGVGNIYVSGFYNE